MRRAIGYARKECAQHASRPSFIDERRRSHQQITLITGARAPKHTSLRRPERCTRHDGAIALSTGGPTPNRTPAAVAVRGVDPTLGNAHTARTRTLNMGPRTARGPKPHEHAAVRTNPGREWRSSPITGRPSGRNTNTLHPKSWSEHAHSGPRDRNKMHVRARERSSSRRRNGRSASEPSPHGEQERNTLLHAYVFMTLRARRTFASFMARNRPSARSSGEYEDETATWPDRRAAERPKHRGARPNIGQRTRMLPPARSKRVGRSAARSPSSGASGQP